ncbi:MAG: anti-sigma factor domain-containing protein [Paracoccus sp. (in: a-proteobacteria)]|uniref:anti-sigma factor n=1 Tax=Paracoccus sp. TaxID=267 RepID=UPI00391C89A1
MTDDAPLTPPEQDEALAAELALGLLDGPEAEAAVARLSTDPVFAQSVRDWQELLAGLALRLTPVMAPARARQAIRERLGHSVAPLSTDPNARTPWWRGPWGVIGGLLAAAVLAVVLILPGLPDMQATPPDYQAQLVSDDQALQVAALVDGREMEIALHSGAAPSGRDWEIWWIEPDGSAPISIGLVPREGNLRMTLPEGLDPSDAIRLALSDEPEGGSPTGQATGPIVAIAALTSS